MTVVEELETILNDSGVFFPTNQLYDCLNEAQLTALADSRWNRTSVTLSVNTGDDLVVIPPAIVIPQIIELQGHHYFASSQLELEHFNRLWRGDGLEQPKWFILWDYNHFRLYHRPDQPYDFTLWGLTYPATISDTNTDIADDDSYRMAVVYRAAALALEFTRPDLSDAFMQLGEERLNWFNKMRRNQQGHNIRQLRPGTIFSEQPDKIFDAAQGGEIRIGNMFPPVPPSNP